MSNTFYMQNIFCALLEVTNTLTKFSLYISFHVPHDTAGNERSKEKSALEKSGKTTGNTEG